MKKGFPMKTLLTTATFMLALLSLPVGAVEDNKLCPYEREKTISELKAFEAERGIPLPVVADNGVIFAVKLPNSDMYAVSIILPGDCLSEPFLATGDQLYKQFGVLIN